MIQTSKRDRHLKSKVLKSYRSTTDANIFAQTDNEATKYEQATGNTSWLGRWGRWECENLSPLSALTQEVLTTAESIPEVVC